MSFSLVLALLPLELDLLGVELLVEVELILPFENKDTVPLVLVVALVHLQILVVVLLVFLPLEVLVVVLFLLLLVEPLVVHNLVLLVVEALSLPLVRSVVEALQPLQFPD